MKLKISLFICLALCGCSVSTNDLKISVLSSSSINISKGEEVKLELEIKCDTPIQDPLSLSVKNSSNNFEESITIRLNEKTSISSVLNFKPPQSGVYTVSIDGFRGDPNTNNNKKEIEIMVTQELAIITTQYGDMVVDFFEDTAPQHVESFKLHAKTGYYNGTIFHRVIPGFVIQGGDPNTKGENKASYGMGGHAAKFFGVGNEKDSTTWNIPAEFNELKHKHGILSMARSSHPNSSGSQFFICAGDVSHLDGQYTVFGQVIEGTQVIDQIVNLPRDDKDIPHQRVEMNVRLEQRTI